MFNNYSQEVNHENTSIQKDERCYFSTEISQTKLIANKGLVTNNLKCIKGGDRRLKTNKNKMKNDFMMSLQKKISQMTNSSNIQIFSNSELFKLSLDINMVDESNNACFTTGGIKGNFSNTPHPQPKIMFSR